MSSSWPVGVTTQEDMHRYAKTLFADCKIENLLTGMEFDAFPGCFLIHVNEKVDCTPRVKVAGALAAFRE